MSSPRELLTRCRSTPLTPIGLEGDETEVEEATHTAVSARTQLCQEPIVVCMISVINRQGKVDTRTSCSCNVI